MAMSNQIAELQAMRRTRLIAQAAASLPKTTQRNRLDCLIYFHTRIFPWKVRKRGLNGEVLELRVEEGESSMSVGWGILVLGKFKGQ